MVLKTAETETSSSSSSYRQLDGPKAKGLRRIFRLLRLILWPVSYMDDSVKRYGPVFIIGANSDSPLVYAGEPEIVRELFSLDANQVLTGQSNAILQSMVGEHSILLMDGKAHQRERKLLMPPFHGDRLRDYAQLICEVTHQVSAEWKAGDSVVVRPPMQALSLGVILQAVFGFREGDRLAELQRLMSALLDSFTYPISASFLFFPLLQKDLGPWSPWGRFIRLREQIRRLLYDEIRERRQSLGPSELGSATDILSMLLLARDESGEAMTDGELHDELVTLLLAGHETTTSAIAWMLYWIHYLPTVKEKLSAELATLGPDPDPLKIVQLPYLNAVCQETLRIYPITPSAFLRVLSKPRVIANYSFKAGTALMPATYIIHQRPDLYPDPKQFRPERFLERQYAPHEYLPFGGGHRRCIGSALAMMELKLSVTTLLQRFELVLAQRRPLSPVRRGLTLAPPASLKLKVKSKLQG